MIVLRATNGQLQLPQKRFSKKTWQRQSVTPRLRRPQTRPPICGTLQNHKLVFFPSNNSQFRNFLMLQVNVLIELIFCKSIELGFGACCRIFPCTAVVGMPCFHTAMSSKMFAPAGHLISCSMKPQPRCHGSSRRRITYPSVASRSAFCELGPLSPVAILSQFLFCMSSFKFTT
jgi:hypothetical protein